MSKLNFLNSLTKAWSDMMTSGSRNDIREPARPMTQEEVRRFILRQDMTPVRDGS